jgi:hypothetical protein
MKKRTIDRKIATRRYYFQKALKGKYRPIEGNKRSLDVPFKSFTDIPVGERYYVGKLIELGFNVQLKLF